MRPPHLRTRGAAKAAAVLALTGALAGCGGGHGPGGAAERAPVAAELATAALAPVPVLVEVTGTVEPWVRVSPGSKILGRVGRVSVREGDRVRKGEVVVELDKRDLEAAAAQARAAVAMAEATLENARAQFERMTQLHARGSVTDKNLEDATSGYRVAEAAVAQARANLEAAEIALGYGEIRSPVAGYVVDKRVEPGDMAAPGAPLLTLEDLSRVKVVVQVSESDVVGMSEGDPARVAVDALGDDAREARVDRIVPSGDRTSRTYRVQLVLDNPEGRIKSGMFARAWFDRGRRDALLVPQTAVFERGQLTGMFVVGDDGVARLRWVRAGRRLDGDVEVISGLRAGERYVPSPPPDLADGSPVEAR